MKTSARRGAEGIVRLPGAVLAALLLAGLAIAVIPIVLRTDGMDNSEAVPAERPARPLATARPVPMPVGDPASWQLVFEDEFDGSSLDGAKWVTCYPWYDPQTGCTNEGNNELEWNLPNGVSVSGGTLKLTARKRTVTGTNGKIYNYTSGMVSTGPSGEGDPGKFSYLFGFAEARVKLPAGKGYRLGFWTLPTDRSWPPEIDIMEAWGDRNQVTMNVHWEDGSEHNQDMTYFTGPYFTAGFHVFGMYWSPNEIVWYIDGVPVRILTDASRIPAKPMYLILDLGIDGNNPPNATTPFPGVMEVDYVRVWEK